MVGGLHQAVTARNALSTLLMDAFILCSPKYVRWCFEGLVRFVAEQCAATEYHLGYAEQYNSFNTLQFADYSKMDANMFDPAEKKRQHQIQFPIDEEKCFEMGIRLAKKASDQNV